MLTFSEKPDDYFQATLDLVLVMKIDELRRDGDAMGELSRWFDAEQLSGLARNILKAHRASEVFQINDWHYLVIYYLLKEFCEVHNEQLIDLDAYDYYMETETRWSRDDKIDFDELLDYFWDTDFLMNKDEFNDGTMEQRSTGAYSDELFGIVNELKPSKEELALTPAKTA